MAEDSEGLKGQEYIVKNPEALKTGVRERVKGVLDWVIDRNPLTKEQNKALDKIWGALPEGRIKDATRLALDVTKVPRGMSAAGLEMIKTLLPVTRLFLAAPEAAVSGMAKGFGFIGEKIVESGPAKFAVGTVEAVMDRILGGGKPREVAATVPQEPVTPEGARQVLVGMARPETGKQERRKLG